MKQIKYSIQTYTVRNSLLTYEDFDASMRRLAEMGYTSVQTRPTDFLDGTSLAALLAKYGLSADSAFCPLYEILSSADRISRDAEALGTDVLRTDSIAPADRKTADGYHRAAEHLNACGKLLRGRGLKFMYHFHSFEFVTFGDVRGIDILLSETDPGCVLFQPDVFWLAAAGTEPSVSLEMFAGRAEYMHVKDYVIVPGTGDKLEETFRASAPVGDGNLNWKAILETARRIGITNFVAEDDMGILDPFESARRSILGMKRLGF